MDSYFSFLNLIKSEITEFLSEAGTHPLYKLLPVNNEPLKKIKVRKNKRSNNFDKLFNNAFSQETKDIRQRSLYASGKIPASTDPLVEPYYIFPINGYKYLYCSKVQQSNEDYKAVVDLIFDRTEYPEDLMHDLLKFTYSNKDMQNGIVKGAEMIFYNIPYYYAIKVSNYKNYKRILTDINLIHT